MVAIRSFKVSDQLEQSSRNAALHCVEGRSMRRGGICDLKSRHEPLSKRRSISLCVPKTQTRT